MFSPFDFLQISTLDKYYFLIKYNLTKHYQIKCFKIHQVDRITPPSGPILAHEPYVLHPRSQVCYTWIAPWLNYTMNQNVIGVTTEGQDKIGHSLLRVDRLVDAVDAPKCFFQDVYSRHCRLNSDARLMFRVPLLVSVYPNVLPENRSSWVQSLLEHQQLCYRVSHFLVTFHGQSTQYQEPPLPLPS